MAQRRFRTNVVVSYEPDEGGWVKATLPAMPAVVTAGISREDAREMIVDALMQVLAVEPERQAGGDYGRVRLDVSTAVGAQRNTAARTKPTPTPAANPRLRPGEHMHPAERSPATRPQAENRAADIDRLNE
jgi:predicted RNase H-like HicB family nuclease